MIAVLIIISLLVIPPESEPAGATTPDSLLWSVATADTQYTAGSAQVRIKGGEVHIEYENSTPANEMPLSALHGPSETLYLFFQFQRELFRLTADGAMEHLHTFPTQLFDNEFFGIQSGARMAVGESGRHLYFWPEGLGQVTRFDLATLESEVISQTLIQHMAVDHTALIRGENKIHVMGGYGLWTHWNKILYYSDFTKGWELLEAVNEDLLPTLNTKKSSFVYDEARDRYLYVMIHPPSESGLDGNLVSGYSFDPESRRWSHLSTHLIPNEETVRSQGGRGVSELRGQFSGDQFDPATGWVAIGYGLFYDSRNQRILIADEIDQIGLPSSGESRFGLNVLFHKKSNRWLFVTRANTFMGTKVVVHGHDTSNLDSYGRRISTVELAARSLLADPVQPASGWVLFGGLLILMFTQSLRPSRLRAGRTRMRAVIARVRDNREDQAGWGEHTDVETVGQKAENPSPTAASKPEPGTGAKPNPSDEITSPAPNAKQGDDRLWIMEDQARTLRVFHRNEEILLADEHFERLISILAGMKRDNLSDMLLTTVDAQLFPHQSNSVSRRRNKLIATLNSILGHEVVTIQRNQTDRRFRFLKVDLSYIALG